MNEPRRLPVWRNLDDAQPVECWPDITLAALEALQHAFSALNQAPGYSALYHEVQGHIAIAHSKLKDSLT